MWRPIRCSTLRARSRGGTCRSARPRPWRRPSGPASSTSRRRPSRRRSSRRRRDRQLDDTHHPSSAAERQHVTSTLKIGTAPDSWGVWFPSDPEQVPAERFLAEVVEAGYEAIELGPYGYLPNDPNE